jgi:hypothetical protein
MSDVSLVKPVVSFAILAGLTGAAVSCTNNARTEKAREIALELMDQYNRGVIHLKVALGDETAVPIEQFDFSRLSEDAAKPVTLHVPTTFAHPQIFYRCRRGNRGVCWVPNPNYTPPRPVSVDEDVIKRQLRVVIEQALPHHGTPSSCSYTIPVDTWNTLLNNYRYPLTQRPQPTVSNEARVGVNLPAPLTQEEFQQVCRNAEKSSRFIRLSQSPEETRQFLSNAINVEIPQENIRLQFKQPAREVREAVTEGHVGQFEQKKARSHG